MPGRRLKDTFWIAYSLLLHGVDHASLPFSGGRGRGQGAPSEVLLVRLDAIGDFVLWLDGLKEIRRLYPPDRFRITLLGNRIWTPLAERFPWFDQVIPVDRKRFYFHPAYRIRTLRALRQAGFDVVLQPTFSREFLYGDSVVRFCGARERIGFAGDTLNQLPILKRISDSWYTRLVPASGGPLMELERNAEFLRGLGVVDFRAGVPSWPGKPAGYPPLREYSGSGYYVLFPGANVALRQWPAERFARIAERLHLWTGWTGVVCGAEADREFGERLLRLAGAPLRNLAGETSLPELASVIAGSRLLVGNETGAIHIAAALSVPSVCILGGGHYGRFAPYRTEVAAAGPLPVTVSHPMDCFHCNWFCIFDPKPGEPAPCIANVSVDAVWEAVKALLPAGEGPRQEPGAHAASGETRP